MAPSCTKLMNKKCYAVHEGKKNGLERHHISSNICKFVRSLEAPTSAIFCEDLKRYLGNAYFNKKLCGAWLSRGVAGIRNDVKCSFRESLVYLSKKLLRTMQVFFSPLRTFFRAYAVVALKTNQCFSFFEKMWKDDDDGKKGVQSHRTNHIVPALDDTSRDMTTRYTNERLNIISRRIQLRAYILSID